MSAATEHRTLVLVRGTKIPALEELHWGGRGTEEPDQETSHLELYVLEGTSQSEGVGNHRGSQAAGFPGRRNLLGS